MLKPAHLMLLGLCTSLFWTSISFAKDINLYDQPDNKAKVIGAIDLSAGIIPILTPKDGTWVKVADPRNGNVGWIQSNELNAGEKSPHAAIFTQRIINSGNGPQSYQIIQYGGQAQKLNAQQVRNMMQKMQMQHQVAQESMQKALKEMVKDMNTFYNSDWNTFSHMHFPMIMPIVIMPSPKEPAPTQPQTVSQGEGKSTAIANNKHSL